MHHLHHFFTVLSRGWQFFLYCVSFGQAPDPRALQRVLRRLSERPALSEGQWQLRFWAPLGVRPEVSRFVYQTLGECSGLDIARVIPTDRLFVDLEFGRVCWGDWEFDYIDAIVREFRKQLQVSELRLVYSVTVSDLVLNLNVLLSNDKR